MDFDHWTVRACVEQSFSTRVVREVSASVNYYPYPPEGFYLIYILPSLLLDVNSLFIDAPTTIKHTIKHN